MRAILLASATAASFGGLRFSKAISQGDGGPRPCLPSWIPAVAPATSTLRNLSSPARVILPSRVLPAVEWSFGVRPSQARKMPPGGERAWIWHLHHQRRGADRPDPRNLRQTPAVVIGAVPGLQPDLDRPQLHLQLRVIPALESKQIARQFRNAFVLRQPRQQRLDL